MHATLRAAVVHATLTGSLSASGVRERYKAVLKRRSQGGGDGTLCGGGASPLLPPRVLIPESPTLLLPK